MELLQIATQIPALLGESGVTIPNGYVPEGLAIVSYEPVPHSLNVLIP